MAETRSGDIVPAVAVDRAAPSGTHLVFRVGTLRYGLPIASILRVVTYPHVTRTPAAPAHVLGVFAHGGRVAGVWDLQTLLAVPEAPPASPPVLLVDTPEGLLGLAVTAVDAVARIGKPLTRAPRAGDTHAQAQPLVIHVVVDDAEPPADAADDADAGGIAALPGVVTPALARPAPADLRALVPFALLDVGRIIALGTGRPHDGGEGR